MTDNAEQGEQPSDPVARSGIGVGVVPDDYADGAAEQEFEESGSIGNPRGAAPDQADTHGEGSEPGEQMTPLAETKAAESRLEAVDEWGTGDDEAPFAAPGADREDGGAT
jgi:hypothetical protein